MAAAESSHEVARRRHARLRARLAQELKNAELEHARLGTPETARAVVAAREALLEFCRPERLAALAPAQAGKAA